MDNTETVPKERGTSKKTNTNRRRHNGGDEREKGHEVGHQKQRRAREGL